jgi:hypothetical protein
MLSDLQESARRLDQQITSFEKLHGEELKKFQEQLETYQRLQNDEMQMLRDQLKRLKDEIVVLQTQTVETPKPAMPLPHDPGISRRDFLVNTLHTIEPKRG